MMQIVEQTREEKILMYLKCSKRELAEMLINCNDIIRLLTPSPAQPITWHQGVTTYYPPCQHEMQYVQDTSAGGGFYQCKKCGYTPQTIPAHQFQS